MSVRSYARTYGYLRTTFYRTEILLFFIVRTYNMSVLKVVPYKKFTYVEIDFFIFFSKKDLPFRRPSVVFPYFLNILSTWYVSINPKKFKFPTFYAL